MKKRILGTVLWFGMIIGLIVVLAAFFELSVEDAQILLLYGTALYAVAAAIGWIRRRRARRPAPRRRLWIAAACALTAIVVAIAGGYWMQRPRIPEQIAEFVRKYPEAQAFADEYAAEHGRSHEIDLTGELSEGGIPLLIQWDRRWGYEQYGANFLGVNGCGPTCLSMVLCGLTGSAEQNPLAVARFSEAQGYYYNGSGTSWELMTIGAERLGLVAEEGEISAGYILENLSPSTPMICSMKPGDFTYTGHFIVLTGVDERGEIRVNDPNSPSRSARSWSVDALVPQIKAIWRYAA